MNISAQEAFKVHALIQDKIRDDILKVWEGQYGPFDKTNYEEYTIQNIPSESTFYHGELIKWMQDYAGPKHRILFAGEGNTATEYIKQRISVSSIYTTGLLKVDFPWNFEQVPPESMGKFTMIVSQAILEHLFDPAKHVKDLISLLEPNGYLIIHTVCPGFVYHRYPIDTFRFFPDWFEEIAKRFKLNIVKKRVKIDHIFYMFQSTGLTGGPS
jgi:SAM-dependent methyltransferase